MAAWIEEQGSVRPRLVVCSTAARARQTLDLVLPALGSPLVVLDEALYHASATVLLDRVRRLDDAAVEALLIGHNPGLQDLALLLSTPSRERDDVAAKLPTGALVTLELEVAAWSAAAAATGRIASVTLPRALD
jgi:phosphohistidine phosphatase